MHMAIVLSKAEPLPSRAEKTWAITHLALKTNTMPYAYLTEPKYWILNKTYWAHF